VDSSGNIWTVSGGVVYENGKATASSTVSLLLYYDGTIYAENSTCWWSWNGTGWTGCLAGDPEPSTTHTPTPTPTSTSTATPTPTPAPTNAIYADCNNGSGGNGTPASPYGSLSRAQSAAADVTNPTIIFSGTCTLTGNLNLVAGETLEGLCGQTDVINGQGQYMIEANGNNISIYDVTFSNLGGVSEDGSGFPGGGIMLLGTDEQIRWNTFTSCTNACISGNNVENSIIDSNTINGVSGSQGSFEAAITLYGISNDNTISNNLIENDGTQGVAWYGNNNLITDNVMDSVALDCSDCGGIYSYDPGEVTSGTQITNNFLLDTGGTTGCSAGINAIYLDNGVSGVTVEGNTIVNPNGMGNGIFVHGGTNDQVIDNTIGMGSCGVGIGAATGSGGPFTAYVNQGNTVEPASQAPSTPSSSQDPSANTVCAGD
jgi:Right handed beta helix region